MLYLKEGKPVIKFLSIESPESADAAGIHKSIKTAFDIRSSPIFENLVSLLYVQTWPKGITI